MNTRTLQPTVHFQALQSALLYSLLLAFALTASPAVTADEPAEPAETSASESPADGSVAEKADNENADNENADNENADNEKADNDQQLGGLSEVEELTELTIGSKPVYPDRNSSAPEWLEADPWRKDGNDYLPVTSKIGLNEEEARKFLDEEVRDAVGHKVAEELSSSEAASLIRYTSKEIKRQCIKEEPFVEEVIGTYGSTWQAHALLVFDEDFKRDLSDRWHRVEATHRLSQTGLGAAFVLLLLSALFGYFRLDTATRGYYTGRLQFATAGTILAIVVASLLLAHRFPWM